MMNKNIVLELSLVRYSRFGYFPMERFQQDLFMGVETIKLMFLSMGITLPVWLCNTIFVAVSLD